MQSPPTATLGVPTLRSALRRAERLGAHVETVKRTGEVRVVSGETRLVINARRKDSTRELTALVAELEAQAPNTPIGPVQGRVWPQEARTDATSQPVTVRTVTNAARIEAHIRREGSRDANGWREYEARLIGEALGLNTTQVASWAAYRERSKTLELYRPDPPPSKRIRYVRFPDEIPMGRDGAPPVLNGAAGPALRSVPTAPSLDPVQAAEQAEAVAPPSPDNLVTILPTPALARYAEALKLARTNDLLRAELSDEQSGEVLREAVRLFYWVRASKGSDR